MCTTCMKKISFEKKKNTIYIRSLGYHYTSSTPFILSLAHFSTNLKYLERHVIRIIVERISTPYYRAM